MKEIYFAMLYYKLDPVDNVYSFIPIRALVGIWDEKSKTFYSEEGKKYFLLSNPEFLKSKKKSAIENVISLEECASYFDSKKEGIELFKIYHKVFQKVSFVVIQRANEFFTIRYHEYMLLVGIRHLKGLVEIEEKQNFKRNLAKYGILAHSKNEKEK